MIQHAVSLFISISKQKKERIPELHRKNLNHILCGMEENLMSRYLTLQNS